MKDLTEDQMSAIESEAEIAAVARLEEELLGVPFVPWMPEDGEETDFHGTEESS